VGALLADPNIALLLVMAGLAGLFWEWHAPGALAPGLAGTVLVCIGIWELAQDSPTWYGTALLLAALLLLSAELKYSQHGVSGVLGAILLFAGARELLPGPRRINPGLAISLSVSLCGIAVVLGVLGVRARHSRVLTGVGEMVGAVGKTCTPIEGQGTVFVRGEYWQARSGAALPAGARISVERVQDLVLYVKEI
jgi:membrane-bound serine protease (ClpP class)